MRISFLIAGFGAAVALSGCAQITALSHGANYAGVASDLADATASAAGDMPQAGSAEYDGIALVAVQDGLQAVGLAGDVALTANFTAGGGTLAGTIDSFVGAELDPADLLTNPTDNIYNMDLADGEIAVTNGVITGSTFTADFAGDLEYDNSDITLAGNMEGQFFGDDGELLEADATSSIGTIDATLDGSAASNAWLSVIAGSE